MKPIFVTALLLFMPILLRAEDWTTVDGKIFKNVKVLSHDDGYVTILDDDGGARLMLTELPPALRPRFGFDPVKASAFVAATEAAETKDQAALTQERQKENAAAAPAITPAASVATAALAPAPPLPPPLPGDLMQNGDFSRGGANWQGDGTPAPSGAGASQGLVVALNPSSWTRVYQEFDDDPGTQYSIRVTYRVMPGTTLSKDPASYADISKKLDITGFENFSSMNLQPGEFYGTIGDPASPRIAMEVFNPKLGSGDVQTYQHSYPAIPTGGHKIFALAFPPGTGTVVLLSVAVTGK